MRKKREPKPQPIRKVGLGLSLAALALLAASMLASYLFGRTWTPWLGKASILLAASWMGLTLLAVVMLILDFVRNPKTPLLTVFTALLFALLVGTQAQLWMEGPELPEIPFQYSFQQRVEAISPPSELQTAARELLTRVRATDEETASFDGDRRSSAVPEALARLQPEWVEVDVKKELVTLDWPERFGWALEITPRGLKYRTSGD